VGSWSPGSLGGSFFGEGSGGGGSPSPGKEASEAELKVRAIAADMGAESEARRDAQQRRAVGELMFYASKGDVSRCRRLVEQFGLDLADCIDYDRRTPLHVAAAEGCVGVTEWLLEAGADVNAADRAGSTPLNDALLGDCKVCAQIIAAAGGKVSEAGRLVYFRNSSYADLAAGGGASGVPGRGGAGGGGSANILGLANDWEMDRREVTVKQRLGEGQFGIVNCGEWRGTPVAVKTFKGSDLITEGEITQELSMLQGLHHPHVIQFIGACTKVTPYFLVTELALGGSLADVFNMRVQPGVKRCLVIALHAARGMAYLHGRKPHPVIHRDLKPANIMVCGHVDDTCTRKDLVFRHGVVKVADFGLSRSLQGGDDEELHPGQTAATAPLAGAGSPSYEMTGETGSYRYMAPEVFKHQRYGHKVDIFAYGVIIFQLFEKRVPFEGLAPEAMARMVAEKNLRPAFAKPPRKTRGSMMAQTPAAVRQLIQECWHPQPERRPEFSEICKRLEAVIAGTTKKKPEPGGAGLGAGGAAGGTSGGSATSTLAAFLGSLGFNKTPSR